MQQKKKQTKSRVLWNYIVHTFSQVFHFIVIAVFVHPVRLRFVRFSVNHPLYNKRVQSL